MKFSIFEKIILSLTEGKQKLPLENQRPLVVSLALNYFKCFS